jgi:hypothetical protein
MARRKIIASTDNSGWVAPKPRKKRKPMTEQQRVAAAERLEIARAMKALHKTKIYIQRFLQNQTNIFSL